MTPNDMQQDATVCKRTQHVTSGNVAGSCLPTMFRPLDGALGLFGYKKLNELMNKIP